MSAPADAVPGPTAPGPDGDPAATPTAARPGTPATPTTSDGTARQVARHGVLGLAGAVCTGAGGFALTFAVGRLLDDRATGEFFSAVAAFTIATAVLLLGADTGLVRGLSGLRATGRRDLLAPTLRAALLPVAAASAAVATVVFVAAEPLARLLVDDAQAATLAGALRLLAPFLVLSTLSTGLLNGASRGLGAMRTYTLYQQVLLPVSRPLLLLVAVLGFGAGLHGALAVWAAPVALAALAAGRDVRARLRDLRRATPSVPAQEGPRDRDDTHDAHDAHLGRRFWRLTAPRGVAAVFEVLITWADVLLVTAIRGPVEAGVYAAASRFVTSGTLAMQAIRLSIAPAVAAAFSRGDREQAQAVHRMSTVGAVVSTWPVYLGMAVYAPAVLSLLGPRFVAGSDALAVLCVAMLGVVATGNANTVLNMAGKSHWAAVNTGVATAVMLAVDLALVPHLGMVGAAIGWGAALLTDATLGTLELRRGIGIRFWDRRATRAAASAVGAFGGTALLARALLGGSLPAAAGGVVLASAVYGVTMWAQRRALGLDAFAATLRKRGGGADQQVEERRSDRADRPGTSTEGSPL